MKARRRLPDAIEAHLATVLDVEHEDGACHIEQRISVGSINEAAYTRAHRASASRTRAFGTPNANPTRRWPE